MKHDDLQSGWVALWKPRERLALSDWAERNLWMSPEYSKRTGPIQLFGWQREIFNAFTDDRVRRIHLMCGVQLVKTLLIQAALAFVIAETPGPTLLVQPKESAARKFSKKRLGPMLRDCPILRNRVSAGRRDRENTIDYKAFPGGDVSIVGAIAPDNLARESIRFLFLDEVDKYPVSAGSEGDPVDLAVERTITFGSQGKIILACSPTLAGRSRIGKAFADSDQRKPWVPCPACGGLQILRWEQVRWPPARYQCEFCQHAWSDLERWASCERAEWRAEATFSGTAGFWISHLYSPWKTLEQIVRQYHSVKDDPARYQTWWNTTLGLLWEDRGEAPDHEKLMARREESYRLGRVPEKVAFLTCGVDVQKSWLEGYIYGWGRGKQRWMIDHFRIEGDPYGQEVWEKLTIILNSTYRHPSGLDLAIVRLGIDSSYATNEVYAWARQQGSGRVLALDPKSGGAALVGMPSQVDLTLGGRKIRRGVKLWPVNVSMAKSELYSLLAKDRPAEGQPFPAGWFHTPADAPEEFFKQLTAEALVTRLVKGYRRSEWVKDPARRNEALDCANYARAAAFVFGMDRRSEDARWWNQFLFARTSREEVSSAGESAQSPLGPPPSDIVKLAASASSRQTPKPSRWMARFSL